MVPWNFMFLLVVVIASIIATYSAIPQLSAPTINESVEGDFVAVIYEAEQQSYIGVFVDIVESDKAGLESFMEPSVTFKSNSETFRRPKKPDEIWLKNSSVLCLIPPPWDTKRNFKIDDESI